MKHIKLALLLMIGIALAGCAGQEITPTELHLAQMQMSQKTLTVECPQGCQGLKVEYRDPRDTINLPHRTNGWDFANNLVNKATGVAPWVAITKTAVQGFKAAGDNVSGSYNSDSSHTGDVIDDSSSHVTDSYNADSTSSPTVVNQPPPVVIQGGVP